MNNFADLCDELDQSISTKDKSLILSDYLRTTAAEDKLYSIELLLGKRPKRAVTTGVLRSWTVQHTELPEWLFEESLSVVGTKSETMALLLAKSDKSKQPTLSECLLLLEAIRDEDESSKQKRIEEIWAGLNAQGLYVFNKLLTGGFRMKLSHKIVSQALSEITGNEEYQLSHKLIGDWSAKHTTFSEFVEYDQESDRIMKPYPFHLVGAVRDHEGLGTPGNWVAELDWEGIRCQLICRGGRIFMWSDKEGMLIKYFPEFSTLANHLPSGTVIDGTVIGCPDAEAVSIEAVKTRLSKTRLSKKVLSDNPVYFIAHDLLEKDGQDIRSSTLEYRRANLTALLENLENAPINISELISFDSWDELQNLGKNKCKLNSRGLLLKRRISPYKSGRVDDDWWKWKPNPFKMDGVLLYVQQGQGEKSNVFTEFTFAVWKEEELLTIAKINVDIDDAELLLINRFVEENTVDRFGPVRSVKPHLVFEIEFEGIQRSRRHKSGITLRSAKLLNWKREKAVEEASHLNDLMRHLVND